MYIESSEWKSFEDSGAEPTIGERVYALYDADHKWYRGRVEETKSSRVSQHAQRCVALGSVELIN